MTTKIDISRTVDDKKQAIDIEDIARSPPFSSSPTTISTKTTSTTKNVELRDVILVVVCLSFALFTVFHYYNLEGRVRQIESSCHHSSSSSSHQSDHVDDSIRPETPTKSAPPPTPASPIPLLFVGHGVVKSSSSPSTQRPSAIVGTTTDSILNADDEDFGGSGGGSGEDFVDIDYETEALDGDPLLQFDDMIYQLDDDKAELERAIGGGGDPSVRRRRRRSADAVAVPSQSGGDEEPMMSDDAGGRERGTSRTGQRGGGAGAEDDQPRDRNTRQRTQSSRQRSSSSTKRRTGETAADATQGGGLKVVQFVAPKQDEHYISDPIPPATFTFWQPENWTSSLGNQSQFYELRDGEVTILESGIYNVYAQILFHDVTGRWSFGVFVDSSVRIKCLNTEQLDHSRHHQHQQQQQQQQQGDSSSGASRPAGGTSSSSSSGSHSVYQHCHTSGLLRLRRYDKVSVRCLYGNKSIVMQPAFTFWGLIKMVPIAD